MMSAAVVLYVWWMSFDVPLGSLLLPMFLTYTEEREDDLVGGGLFGWRGSEQESRENSYLCKYDGALEGQGGCYKSRV